MPGYSQTPLWQKLGVGAHSRLAVLNAPPDFKSKLSNIPAGVALLIRPRTPVDTVIAFSQCRQILHAHLDKAPRILSAHGGFWIAWPKKSSGITSEIDFASVQKAGLARGLVDNKVCAISEVWSGLRFVVPVDQRKTWPLGLTIDSPA